jgi:hypothetical protein
MSKKNDELKLINDLRSVIKAFRDKPSEENFSKINQLTKELVNQ